MVFHRGEVDVPDILLLRELFMLFSPAYTTLFTDMGWSYLWYFTEVGWTYLIFYFVLIVHDALTSPHHPVHKCGVVIPMVFHRGGEDVPGVSLCVNCSWYCHQPTPPSSQRWGGHTCGISQRWGEHTWCFTLCEMFMVLSPAHTTQFTEVGWTCLVFHFV